jgi:sugar phosphate isomerase/epimerase
MFRSLDAGSIGVTSPFEQVVEWAAQAGFQGVSLPLDQAIEKGPEYIREVLLSHNLQPAVFGLPVDYRQDEITFDASVAEFPKQAEIAAKTGVERCSTWVLPGRKDMTDAEYFAVLKLRLGECAKILEERGIRLGLEFLGPKTLRQALELESDGLYTAERMLELVAAIGVPGTGLLLDSWHWHTSHGTSAVFDHLTNDLVVDVHVNDAPQGVLVDELVDNCRCQVGATGVIDLAAFFEGLRKIGYDGPVAVEPFSQELSAMADEKAVKVTAEALKKFC